MASKKRHIILCCGQNGRGVVYGTVSKLPVNGEPVELRDARMVLYWSQECGGLFGLAANGPKTTTRITHAVPRTVETVWQEWTEVTTDAVTAFDKWSPC